MRNGVKWDAPLERHFKSLLESDPWGIKMSHFTPLHIRKERSPPSGEVMTERGDADCAFSMCNGVILQGFRNEKN